MLNDLRFEKFNPRSTDYFVYSILHVSRLQGDQVAERLTHSAKCFTSSSPCLSLVEKKHTKYFFLTVLIGDLFLVCFDYDKIACWVEMIYTCFH